MARNHQTFPYKYFDCTHKLPIIYQSSTEDCAIRILILKCTNKWHENQSAPWLFNCCTKETNNILILYWRLRSLHYDIGLYKKMEFPKSLSAAEFFLTHCTMDKLKNGVKSSRILSTSFPQKFAKLKRWCINMKKSKFYENNILK